MCPAGIATACQSSSRLTSRSVAKSWKWTRHLERHDSGGYHYPAIIQGAEGTLHAIYSYHVAGGKSMKHAAFNEAWVRAGEGK